MVRPISTRITIDASPEFVRQKFLDFPSLPKYHNSFFKSLSAPNLNPGTFMANKIDIMKIRPVILENSERCFKWVGSFLGIFSGQHCFRFEDAGDEEGVKGKKTLFVHEEEFSGILGWIIGEGWIAGCLGMRVKTTRGFEGFNADLKAWCEGKREV